MTHKILHIDSSPMGDKSVSKKLTANIISALKEKFPESTVISHDFGTTPLPHVSPEVLVAFFTPADQQSPAQAAAIKVSDELTEELLNADIIVIGAPMWNLNIPSALKAWIDHIVRAGKTFQYTAEGAKGLVSADKKVIIASSRGGMYTEGPAVGYDFQEPYLKTLFGFLGIHNVSVVRAEGVSMGEAALEKALSSVPVQIQAALAS